LGLPPLSSLVPPGTLNAAVKTPVVMRVETTMHDFAVLFIQDSPFSTSSSCSTVNTCRGVMPIQFGSSMDDTGIIFFTSCHIKILIIHSYGCKMLLVTYF